MLVDPRPYTYEYRKPRYANPTFQSRNLYDSLYHRAPQPNDYFPKVPSKYEQRDRLLRASDSLDLRPQRNLSQPAPTPTPNPNPEAYRLPAIRASKEPVAEERPFMSRSQLVADRREGFQRFRIYERQQKAYNIISCYPKEEESNRLRNFPKLTLENGLIERGSYHSFKEERF